MLVLRFDPAQPDLEDISHSTNSIKHNVSGKTYVIKFEMSETGPEANFYAVTGPAFRETVSATKEFSASVDIFDDGGPISNAAIVGNYVEYYALDSSVQDHGGAPTGTYAKYFEPLTVITLKDNGSDPFATSGADNDYGVLLDDPIFHEVGDLDTGTGIVSVLHINDISGLTFSAPNTSATSPSNGGEFAVSVNGDGNYIVTPVSWDNATSKYIYDQSAANWGTGTTEPQEWYIVSGADATVAHFEGSVYLAGLGGDGNPDGTLTKQTYGVYSVEALVDASLNMIPVEILMSYDPASGDISGEPIISPVVVYPTASEVLEVHGVETIGNDIPIVSLANGDLVDSVTAGDYVFHFTSSGNDTVAVVEIEKITAQKTFDGTKVALPDATLQVGGVDQYHVMDFGDDTGVKFPIIELTANEFGMDAGWYAIYPDFGGIEIQEYNVNGTTGDIFEVPALDAIAPGNQNVVVTDTYTPVVGSNEEMFEIAIAERYGDIIEFGVRLKDDDTTGISDQQSTVTFENIMLDVFWDTDTYDWWQGQFTASPNAPSTTDIGTGAATDFDYYYDNDWRFEEAFKNDGTLKTDTDGNQIYVDADGVEQLDSGGFAVTNETYYARDGSVVPVYGIDQDRFNITMVDNGGMTFEENEFVAKFMLKKKTDETESPFTLGKQQYTVYDPSVTDGDKETPVSEDFYFGFNSHQVGFEIESPRGKEVPNMEMFVTDLSTSDGLSIVPVAKNGDIIKYEVVLNIPTPSFIAGIDVNPNHYIEIHGAGIFENSIQMLTDLTMVSDDGSVSTLTQTGEILNGTTSATSTVKNANGDTLSPDVAIKGSYIGQEFFHKMNAAFDDDLSGSINDLKTTGEITLEFNNLSMPNATKDTAEARYVLAEFYALDHGQGPTIQFESTSLSSTDYTDQSSYVLDGTGIRSITRDYDDTSSSFNGGFFEELADGSEYVILGDGLYANENSYDDAVGAEDALGALRIANMETTPGASAGPYTIEQIIAADFNQNGSVTVGDAADILSYIVHGFEDTLAVPEWVYVNTANITKGTATTDFNGSNVVYDTVIDEFAYGSTNYTAASFDYDGVTHNSLGTLTGILRGDVSGSYDDAGRWTTIDQFSHGIKGLYMFGHLSPGTTSEGDAGYWSSTSDNVVYLGADSGVHNVGDAHIVIVSDVIAGHLNGNSAAPVVGTAFDSADLGSSPKPTDADILSEMASAVGTDDYAVGFWEDLDDYDPTIMATAIEMDGATGITIDDLVIIGSATIVGMGDYMSDPFAYLPDA